MAEMKKINMRIKRNKNIGENDIYRKFSEQFDKLFNADEIAKNDDEFEEIYVPDYEFENQIRDFLNIDMNMVKYCVGYTGIGKTTSIRHIFHLGVSNKPKILTSEKTIVFPTFLDGYQVSNIKHFDLSTRVAAVCTEMREKHSELDRILKTKEGKREFYDFVRRHTGFALENVNPVKLMDADKDQEIQLKLEAAYQYSPLEYQANLLKFYIKKKYDCYEKLVILLDDIESLPEDYQVKTIAEYMKLHKCMQNTDYPDNGKYSIYLMISVRPHTFRIINKVRKIETFATNELPILKEKSVDISLLFKRRFDYYTKNVNKPVGNMDTWQKCYDVLCGMNSLFEGKYKEMICNLCFMNVREALASYSKIFANRFWIQKNKWKEDIFTIRETEYHFNNITVIRALACNEDQAFWGDLSYHIVPNFFYTINEKDLSIYCLLVMKYFINKTGEEVYGKNVEPLNVVKEDWLHLFGPKYSKKMIKALEHLFECKILRKSIKDFDDIQTLDKKESLENRSLLYISPRGAELFEMFKRDSVLLEMLREAAWRNYEGWDYFEETSSELLKEGRQKDIFMDLLEYITYLSECEEDVLCAVKDKNRQSDYIDVFGNYAVTEVLLEGVKNSLNYSGIMHEKFVELKYNQVSNKLRKLMKGFI